MLLNDVLVYRPPSCQAFLAEEGCVKAGPGVRCIWSRGRCLPWEVRMANSSLTPAPFCPPKAGEKDHRTSPASFHFLVTALFVVVKTAFFLEIVFYPYLQTDSCTLVALPLISL